MLVVCSVLNGGMLQLGSSEASCNEPTRPDLTMFLLHSAGLCQVLLKQFGLKLQSNGKYFTVNGLNAVIKEIDIGKDWHYIGCPTCNQLVYPTANQWFCTRGGMHSTSNTFAQLHIQIPPDQSPRKLKCIVNKAVFLEDEVDIGTSTPQPSTPTPKTYPSSSAKRSLDLLDESEDPGDISAHRGKKKT
ncbi:hypothetical protein M8C21_017490 [Ambrosia artemisiifolia]|uniref:Replication factor A C-terminal domain-containing protein n=1 Tax=Ambrosia artemisiifolia TaxID=4212 RepID=A0AAD5BWJ2_AMBAR|nr:hypothetical protein M8C21_017490 [Ambrosia artemisiifolia]